MRLLTVFLAFAFLCGTAFALDKDEALHGPTVVVPLGDQGGRAVGDDCTNPIVIDAVPFYGTGFTTCGALNDYTETCLGSYDGGEDTIFQLTITEQVWVNIIMDPLGTTWTGVAIDDECPLASSCLGFNTGSSGVRTISQVGLAPGTYYIMVDTWPTPDCIPSFNLTIEPTDPPPPPPANDTCEGAIAIERCTSGVIDGDLTWALGNYTPGDYPSSCTGYGALGKDVVYVVDLLAGDVISLVYSYVGTSFDESLYIITDCADPAGTCVAGSDGGHPEDITWTCTADGTYYIICDAYSSTGGGPFTLTYDVTCPLPTAVCCVGENCFLYSEADCGLVGGTWHVDWTACDPNPCEIPVPQDSESWGTIKSVYR